MFNDIYIRPFKDEDQSELERGRREFTAAELETPHGFAGPRVETAVAVKGENINSGKVMASLTGTLAVILDPLLKVPGYKLSDYIAAIFKLEAVLTYLAQDTGAVDSYLAIPNGVTEEEKKSAAAFVAFARQCGYEETVQNCRIFRRSLYPVPLEPAKGNESSQSGTLIDEVDSVTCA